MILLPYCFGSEADVPDTAYDSRDVSHWECFRGVILGLVNFLAFIYCTYATLRIFRVWVRTNGWYTVNLIMLSLASLQCFFTAIKYNLIKEQRLTFTAAYLRGLQSLLACLLYGRAAAEATSRNETYFKYFVPLLALITIYLTTLFFVALALEDIPCHHPTWLIMSASQMFITVVFAVLGIFVMRDLYYSPASTIRREYTDVMDAEQFEVKLQRKALRALLIFNALGASFQLIHDSWLQNKYKNGKDCHFLESADEEIFRIFLKIFSYDVPVLVTVYVFYFLPRRQFDTDLDVTLDDEGIAMESIEDELLQNW